MRVLILVELEFGVLVFVEEGKPENREKNPRSKARANKDKLNPQMALGRNPPRAISRWETSTPITAPTLLLVNRILFFGYRIFHV